MASPGGVRRHELVLGRATEHWRPGGREGGSRMSVLQAPKGIDSAVRQVHADRLELKGSMPPASIVLASRAMRQFVLFPQTRRLPSVSVDAPAVAHRPA
jgi:hypothetical protein